MLTTKVLALATTLVLLTSMPAPAHDMSAMTGTTKASNGMGVHSHMDAHMRMTELRPQTPQDAERAQQIADTLRRALVPYRNYRVPLGKGYSIFLPGVPQDVYHFVDFATSNREYRGYFDPAHPGSLLYVKKPDGYYVLVGAMYSAPPDYTESQLDELIPLSVARWHQHVDICLPKGITLGDMLNNNIGIGDDHMPGMLPIAEGPTAVALDHREGFMADGRFGFDGAIRDPGTCQAAGGHFIPLAFGWMVHVYPFAGDDLKVEYGMDVPKLAPPSS
jgi:hypothetical protein